MAPLPAESQAAIRTHFLPVGLNGIEKVVRLIGASSVVELTCRPVDKPSSQTTSMKSSGKVHSMAATMVRWLPEPLIDHEGMSTSPDVTNDSPRMSARVMSL